MKLNYYGKVYISGGITNAKNYKQHFNNAEKLLRKYFSQVYNPASFSFDCMVKEMSWEDYMKYDLQFLIECNYIYMLKGWFFSKGARLERKIAKKLGIIVLYEGKYE